MRKGRFSFLDFYARRIRRIFPALAVVLAACLVGGAFILDPSEYKEFGLNVAAGAGFLSNALMWSQAGYFDRVAEFKPLLHLWSLAVEEQFYFIWPLALFLWAQVRRPLWPLSVVFAVASFALNLYLAEVDRVADFYFVLARIWELLLGAGLTLAAPAALEGQTKVANAAAAAGLTLIVVSLLLTNNTQAFPGWRALGPTVGATLLIAAGPRAFLNARLFSNRLMVAIGKISYPIYLWHWPLLAFARICAGGEVPPAPRWEMIALAVALSQLTYVYVERPIRLGSFPARNAALAAAAVAALGLIGWRDFQVGGLFFPNATLAVVANEGDVGPDEFLKYLATHSVPCDARLFSMTLLRGRDAPRCGQTYADRWPEVVILGDSHGEHLYMGVSEALPGRNVAWYAGGLPLVDEPTFKLIYEALVAAPAVRAVILSASWAGELKRQPAGTSLRAEIDRALRLLGASGKVVYVANDVPSFHFDAGRCKFSGRLGFPALCDEPEAALDRQLATYENDLKAAVEANPGAQLIDTAHMLCRGDTCSMAEDGKLLYRDDNHLNINGSRLIGARLVAAAPGIAE